jgi:hypothetical protein
LSKIDKRSGGKHAPAVWVGMAAKAKWSFRIASLKSPGLDTGVAPLYGPKALSASPALKGPRCGSVVGKRRIPSWRPSICS